jgi:hypothetical protein
MLGYAKYMYNTIKDNPNIPDDIKYWWIVTCVELSDVKHLCNF